MCKESRESAAVPFSRNVMGRFPVSSMVLSKLLLSLSLSGFFQKHVYFLTCASTVSRVSPPDWKILRRRRKRSPFFFFVAPTFFSSRVCACVWAGCAFSPSYTLKERGGIMYSATLLLCLYCSYSYPLIFSLLLSFILCILVSFLISLVVCYQPNTAIFKFPPLSNR